MKMTETEMLIIRITKEDDPWQTCFSDEIFQELAYGASDAKHVTALLPFRLYLLDFV